MDLSELKKHWNRFGETDALWAILTDPSRKNGKWETDEFFRTGRNEIAAILKTVESLFPGFHFSPDVNLAPLSNSPDSRAKRRNGKALDFGCGVGRLTQAMCDHFEECHGVDIAPSMIELARRFNRYIGSCLYHVNDRPDLRMFAPETFDFIYSNIVLQHMEPTFSSAYIAEFVRVLAPGGALVFQIPSNPAPPRTRGTVSNRPLPRDAFIADISTSVDGLVAQSGSEFDILLRVRNLGRSIWPSGGLPGGKYQILVGNHWLRPSGEVLRLDDRRAYLPSDVKPGEEVGISLRIGARPLPGDYVIEIDLVQEHVAWFADHGSRTLRIPVRIIGTLGLSTDASVAAAHSPEFEPVMEMHGIPRPDVISLLKSSGARVVRCEEDCHAPNWESFRYFATR